MFANLVKELGEVIGLPSLAPDVAGAVTLSVDGFPFILQYYDAGQDLYIIHRLGTLPEAPDQQAAVQRFLLEKNCFFRGVGSGILGIEGNDIFYAVRIACCDKFGERISGAALEHILRAVVDTCADVRSGYSAVISTEQEAGMPTDIEYLSMLRV